MKLLLILLLWSVRLQGQEVVIDHPFKSLAELDSFMRAHPPVKARNRESDELLSLKIVRTDVTAIAFYKTGYRLKGKYYYFDRKRIKPLPKHWIVWDWRVIN
jgi:hypothetical protein